MKKTALILGGNRFFGRHLVQNLLNSNYKVTLLNRGNIDDGYGDLVSRFKVDKTDTDALNKILKNTSWDIVIDQICFTGAEGKALGEILTGKTERLGVTSSQSVYNTGYQIRESVFDPKTHTYFKDVTAKENYAEAKRQMEAEVIKFAQLKPVLFRFPFVIGVDDYTKRMHWHVDQVRNQLPIYFPNLEARLGFIRSDFAGSVIQKVIESNYSGGINCVCPGEISLRSLIEEISNIHKTQWIQAKTNDDKTHSPFGVSNDWTMSIENLKSLGIELPNLQEWLSPLLKSL